MNAHATCLKKDQYLVQKPGRRSIYLGNPILDRLTFIPVTQRQVVKHLNRPRGPQFDLEKRGQSNRRHSLNGQRPKCSDALSRTLANQST